MRAWVSVRKQVEALGVAKELAVVIQGTDDPVLCFQCPPPLSQPPHTHARPHPPRRALEGSLVNALLHEKAGVCSSSHRRWLNILKAGHYDFKGAVRTCEGCVTEGLYMSWRKPICAKRMKMTARKLQKVLRLPPPCRRSTAGSTRSST